MRDSEKTMQQLARPTFSQMALLIGVSLGLHAVTLLVLEAIPARSTIALPPAKAIVQIKEKPKAPPPPPPVSEKPPEEKPKKPEPKAPAEKKPKAPQPTKTANPEAPVKPVLGLNPDSLSKEGSFAVPAGNTTDAKDEGIRLSPEQVKGLAKDLSEDAALISSTFEQPAFTPEAEEAGLEGSYVIEVYVDREGRVTDAELRNKIGYGMDERVLASARKARFKPRRDPLGKFLEGWTEIRVRLTLE